MVYNHNTISSAKAKALSCMNDELKADINNFFNKMYNNHINETGRIGAGIYETKIEFFRQFFDEDITK